MTSSLDLRNLTFIKGFVLIDRDVFRYLPAHLPSFDCMNFPPTVGSGNVPFSLFGQRR